MTSATKPGLSPVAALCLRVVKGWLGVVRRGKGGELRNGVPYTRLKASEVREQLEREQGVEVSTKTVQRALTVLVDAGYLSRRQLYKHRYNRTYWYAPGEREQQVERHRPQAVAAQFSEQASPRPTQSGSTERSPVSLQALKAQVPNSLQKATSSPTAQQPTTEEAPCGSQEPQQEAVSKAWGRPRPVGLRPRTGAHSDRLEQAHQRLAAMVERAKAKGFGAKASSEEQQPSTRYVAESPQAAGFLR